uniref:BZIP domain-containing protein n=1 Tax=Schistocephalus solidus TaxID=70667 RepID=A0A0X3P8X1_SCHSO
MDFYDSPLEIDPGLFDVKPTESTASNSGTSDGVTELRRTYKPVPMEDKVSLEYVIRRKQNNQAVRRCRTLGKLKYKSLLIKTAGYQSLSGEYRTAAKEMEAARKSIFPI